MILFMGGGCSGPRGVWSPILGGGGLQFFLGGWSPILGGLQFFGGGVSPNFWGVSKFFFQFFPTGMHSCFVQK